MKHALELFKIDEFDSDMIRMNESYERGKLSSDEFLEFYRAKFPWVNTSELIRAWNIIIKDFPLYRLDFLKELKHQSDYKLILCSNTNEMHIKYVKQIIPFYEEFRNQFHRFYLSHLVNMRKPDKEIFEMIISENELDPRSCLFIDDTEENTRSAAQLGLKTWTLDPEKDDIIDLIHKPADFFK